MASQAKHVELAGSHRSLMPGASRVGPVGPEERFEVTIRLRPRTPLSDDPRSKAFTGRSIKARHYLTREQHAHAHGATPEDIAEVEAFAKAHKLAVVEASIPRRSVILSGHAADFAAAFGVTLEEYAHPEGGTFRTRMGPIMIPAELEGKVVGVFGLDNRPQARPHFRTRKSTVAKKSAGGDLTQFTPPQVGQLYDFPTNADGTGQCIGIIELGGGFSMADLKTYFNELGIAMPHVSSVSVDHGKNRPTRDPDGPDGEVMLDIEVAASVAPMAKIVVYFTPNTDQGFLDAITKAIHDKVNKPSVISISWGGPESSWTDQAMQQFDEAFQAAAGMGISICVAAGDDGSSDGVGDGESHVDFPASSPNVLACGGTTLNASASSIDGEVVWNDGANGGATGGGVSDEFPMPDYQQNAGVPPSPGTGNPGRGLPDVAGDADPNTGYTVRVDGEDTVIGGTSAVAPLWAGLIALMNQSLGHPVGFLNPVLYETISGDGVFRDVTKGTNGAYSASTGWDACSGWGVADGQKLLQALSSQ